MSFNAEIEKQILDLKDKQAALVMEKKEHETKLLAIKNLVRRGVMDNYKYRQCCDSQTKHSQEILRIEKLISVIRTQLRAVHSQEISKSLQNGNGAIKDCAPIIKELVALREEYQQFSADLTRVSSMRQMASEFVVRLNPIIRRAIGES